MNKRITYILLAIFAITACEPIIKRDELPAPLTEQQIKEQIIINVRSTEEGGNQLILENKSKYGGRWSYPGGVSNSQIDTVVIFPTGNIKITFDATTDAGIVTVERDIVISRITNKLDPPYRYLIGDYGDGVTWVYAKDHPSGNFWGMVSPTDWEEFWWFPDYTGEEFNNEFTFKYDNGYVFIQDGVQGTFQLDAMKMELTLTNPYLHMSTTNDQGQGEEVMKEGKFLIKLLNENEMVLIQKFPVSVGYDWMWRFKRKGYEY